MHGSILNILEQITYHDFSSDNFEMVLAEDLAKKVEQVKACCNNNQHSAGWMLV